ncbi:hypothetical protein [uncultured Anaerococcus sp.]|uniref:hypothetical protein n=1 Tax=uncultured Anaerococcus sp. TaxID=293428 RepID=UPI002633CF84|nr:hypothetical protein [uncultured Anaerococcus sp.]
MFYRYKAAYSTYDTKEHYCWMAYLLANYTSDEVYKLCNEAFVFMKKQAIRRERFLSADIKIRAGQVEISYSVGIGDIAEMARLMI